MLCVLRFYFYGRQDKTLTALLLQFPRPAYQQLAVSKFLENLAPGTYAGLFNPNGRVRRSHRCILPTHG